MCGIFGAVNLNGFFDSADFERFSAQTDLVKYRGPDASGYTAIDLKNSLVASKEKFDVFLGHRRLSIIDLSEDANQPFTDGEGIWIIYNGEIFNYIELKDELKGQGCVFKTQSDTEVVLKLYEKYGPDGFRKMNGMWALGIVDMRTKTIVLSRDRFSIKPLYYLEENDVIYFGSEIKQLIPFIKNKDICREVMYKYIEQGLIDYSDKTFFNNVFKIKPKHYRVISICSSKTEDVSYWDYHIDESIQRMSFAAMVEKFYDLFVDSIKIRLRSDVKIGALLSGGLDSSAISIIADDLQREGLDTYSIISDDKKYSEDRYINMLSAACKGNNYKIPFTFHPGIFSVQNIEKILYHNDEPFATLSVMAHFQALAALKRNSDIKVVLSGQGGDETLMGYSKYFYFNLKNEFKKGAVVNAVSLMLASFLRRTVIWQFKVAEARRYIPFLVKKTPKYFLKIRTELEPVWEADDLRDRQKNDIDKYSVPLLAHYEDRNSMAHSVEIRLPFLDYRLVEYLINLPVTLKIKGGWTKYVLRKALHELPVGVRWRRDKQGFITPEEQWLKKDFSEIIIDVFSKSTLEQKGIIDSREFLKYYRDFQRGSRTTWYTDISRMFMAEIWAKNNL